MTESGTRQSMSEAEVRRLIDHGAVMIVIPQRCRYMLAKPGRDPEWDDQAATITTLLMGAMLDFISEIASVSGSSINLNASSTANGIVLRITAGRMPSHFVSAGGRLLVSMAIRWSHDAEGAVLEFEITSESLLEGLRQVPVLTGCAPVIAD